MSSSVEDGRPPTVSADAFTQVQSSRAVPGAPPQAPQLRLPGHGDLHGLVLPVRPAGRLRPRLHGQGGLRQRQRRDPARAAGSSCRRSSSRRLYVRYANKNLDPDRRENIRTELEGGHVMTYLAAETVGEPAVNIAIFLLFVALTLVIVYRASPQQPHRRGLLRRRPVVHRPAERHRHLRRLPVGRLVPRHRRRHRHQRVRRLPLLDRLPRRLAGRAAARRRAAAQHRPVHDGRRAVVPDAAAPGADGRRDHDARGLALLPAGPDGRRRRACRAAARRRLQGRPERGRSPSSAS